MTLLLPLMPWRADIHLLRQTYRVESPSSTEGKGVSRLLYDNLRNYEDIADNLSTVIVYAVSFVFNLMLLSLFLIFKGLRSLPSNHFIAMLAISNVLLIGHLIVFNIILDPIKPKAVDPLCDFAVCGGLIFCAQSNLSRCAIAIDRYIFISDPLRYYQRTQSNWRSLLFGSASVMSIAIIVIPYLFAPEMRATGNEEIICLPSPPNLYAGCVAFMLTLVPGLFLVVIYSKIFYWAFLQMQILRQEADNFLKKRDPWELESKPSPHTSVSSKQLRVYTGAAILLTPTSPFSSHSSHRHSADFGDNPDEEPEVSTAIHKIIHILSGLDMMREEGHVSVVSTSVDRSAPVATNSKAWSAASGKSLDHLSYSRKAMSTKSFGDIENNRYVRGMESQTKTNGTPRSPNAKNTNESSKSFASSKTSTHSSYAVHGTRSSPIDDLPSSGYSTTWTPRTYVPVTSQGKWMESRLRNYDVEVVRESSSTLQDRDLKCKLLKAEVKAAVMIIALMGAFVLCWMPFCIIEMAVMFNLDISLERRVSILLIVINCALDPLTYALMNPPFRAHLSRSVSALCRNYRTPYSKQPEKRMALKLKLKDNLHKCAYQLRDSSYENTINCSDL